MMMLLVDTFPTIENDTDKAGGGVAVRAAQACLRAAKRTWGEPICEANWAAPAGLDSRFAARHAGPIETPLPHA